jgi:hemolysin III
MKFLSEVLPDGGPIYSETNTHFLIVEPFNAISSLAYLIPALYWFIKLKGDYKDYPFLISCLPFLVLGGIGSTFYHAFRTSSFLLFLDVFPVAIVTFMVSVYFWIKIFKKWWYVFLVIIPFILARYFVFKVLSLQTDLGFNATRQTAINISYFISGVMIFLPALILLIKTSFKNFLPLTTSCVLFILGLFFREMDTWNVVLPMGTHWLWHISTAAGGYFLGEYLFRLRNSEMIINRVFK